jgi:WD repeat-containing protein 61
MGPPLSLHAVAAWTCDVGANDKLLAAGTQQGGVNIWDMQSREKVSSLETRDKFVMSVAFSPDGSKVAGGGQDGNINIFDVAQNTLLQKMEGHALPVRSLRFSPDGTLLYTASDDMRVNVYDVKRSSLVASFTGEIWACSSPPSHCLLEK